MKLKYYPDTDSLYIDLSEKPSVSSQEISEGVVIDFDKKGNVVGIDIDNASKKIALKALTIVKLPFEIKEMQV
ncbi:hypothetical protein HS1_002237 [Candidatus Desulfofervidus auxilii]|uniref:DUF2283 domain-containing protein n=1 Tax=Desulfofervidus auxilii TaxID=1621989 RepID=A0A7U4QME0_DESA2|nr:DUF2283 domain-containing protein [Candidatus Desulfofervidus auxilii]AMM42023.1 hypothetical protein HS1_002237 [Candidatus Desulfofervidus auxilii]MDL1971369.1 DUF2283 domain-containing protein [Candidatus Desulfofervidaceae bacterium]